MKGIGCKKLEQSYLAAFLFERRLQPVAEGPQVKRITVTTE